MFSAELTSSLLNEHFYSENSAGFDLKVRSTDYAMEVSEKNKKSDDYN